MKLSLSTSLSGFLSQTTLSNDWILAAGFWADSGVWDDTATWID